mmetsp:Transcript_1412/g.2131  ORF Transcript_1412/g.2131 Transcript_1412/m.2131 type:complete len:431 (-) Transcript_1412:33-1325(-)
MLLEYKYKIDINGESKKRKSIKVFSSKKRRLADEKKKLVQKDEKSNKMGNIDMLLKSKGDIEEEYEAVELNEIEEEEKNVVIKRKRKTSLEKVTNKKDKEESESESTITEIELDTLSVEDSPLLSTTEKEWQNNKTIDAVRQIFEEQFKITKINDTLTTPIKEENNTKVVEKQEPIIITTTTVVGEPYNLRKDEKTLIATYKDDEDTEDFTKKEPRIYFDMNQKQLDDILEKLKKFPFSEAKMKYILQYTDTHVFRRDQIYQILDHFSISYERRYLLINGLFEAFQDGSYHLTDLLNRYFDFDYERGQIRKQLISYLKNSDATRRPISAASTSSSTSSTLTTEIDELEEEDDLKSTSKIKTLLPDIFIEPTDRQSSETGLSLPYKQPTSTSTLYITTHDIDHSIRHHQDMVLTPTHCKINLFPTSSSNFK